MVHHGGTERAKFHKAENRSPLTTSYKPLLTNHIPTSLYNHNRNIQRIAVGIDLWDLIVVGPGDNILLYVIEQLFRLDDVVSVRIGQPFNSF